MCKKLIDMNNITNISSEAPSTPWDDYVVPNYTAFTTLVLCAVILGRLAFCVPFFEFHTWLLFNANSRTTKIGRIIQFLAKF